MALYGSKVNCPVYHTVLKRGFHVSSIDSSSLKNFRRFPIPNKKGIYSANKIPKYLFEDLYNYPISRDPMGTRWPGYWFQRKFVYVKEMEPELVVPDLTGFELKPYVSYRTPEIVADEFTAEDLFKQTYGNKIIEAYMRNERVELTANDEDIENAKLKQQQTGADLFSTSAQEMEELTP